MRWILVLALLAGCDSSSAGERPVDATGGAPGIDAGAGGQTATGGTAGAVDAGGSGGSVDAGTGGQVATPNACLIPETAITTTAPTTKMSVTGPVPYNATAALSCSDVYDQIPITAGIYQGQVITGTPYTNGWTVKHYMVNPSTVDATKCAAVISFVCAGCAGGCGDAEFEVMLTLPPQ
jgi:hypothetical protein